MGTDETLRRLEREAAQTGDPASLAALALARARSGAPTLPDGWTVDPAPADRPIGTWDWSRFARSVTVAHHEGEYGHTSMRVEEDPETRHSVDREIPRELMDGVTDTYWINEASPLGLAVDAALLASPSGRVILTYRPDPTEDRVWDKHGKRAWRSSPRWESGFGRPRLVGPGLEYQTRYGDDKPCTDDDIRKSMRELEASLAAMPASGINVYNERETDSIPDEPAFLWWARVDSCSDQYGADLLSRTNYTSFVEAHEDAIECGCVVNESGVLYVLLGCTCEHRQSLAETLASLESYPVLDDDAFSRAEMEEQEESWDSCFRSDVEKEIAKRLGAESVDVPKTDSAGAAFQSDPLREWMHTNEMHFEGSGDSMHLDMRPIQKMDQAELMEEMKAMGADIEMPEDWDGFGEASEETED